MSMKLLTQREVNQSFITWLETEDSPLYADWENGDFPDECDDHDTDTYEQSISKLRDLPIAELREKEEPGVILYKSLIELQKVLDELPQEEKGE